MNPVNKLAAASVLAVFSASVPALDLGATIQRFDSLQSRGQISSELEPDVAEVGSGTNKFKLQTARIKGVEGQENKVATEDWKLEAAIPLAFSSNPAKLHTDERDAGHLTPNVAVTWGKPVGGYSVSATAGLIYDRYTSHSVDGTSIAFGNFQIVHGDPTVAFTPTISYAPTAVFDEFLGNHKAVTHDIYAGLVRKLIVPVPHSNMPFNVTLNIGYTRREASVALLEQHRPALVVQIDRKVSERLSWRIKQVVRGEFSTNGGTKGRADLYLQTGVALSYLFAQTASLSAGFTFDRNESNKFAKDYSTWDVGPTLGITLPF